MCYNEHKPPMRLGAESLGQIGEMIMKKIITISREFGSGGRTIGKLVAEKLGYRFYDGELIDEVVKSSGLSREIVEKYDEYATHKNSFLYAIAVNSGGDNYNGLSVANRVQIAQAAVIKQLAEEGNCVIIGPIIFCVIGKIASMCLSARIWHSRQSALSKTTVKQM